MSQNFQEFIELHKVYIDRTDIAGKVCFTDEGKIESGAALILDGPRRSGKTLFLSTIEAIFTLDKDWWMKNCPNLAITKIPNALDNKKLPVIRFNFGQATDTFSLNDLILSTLNKYLPENERLSDDKIALIREDNRETNAEVKNLIKSKGKCVVLIDEFDSPMITLMHSTEFSEEEIDKQMVLLLEAQASFYSAIKELCEKHIAVVVLAGQAKIAITSSKI